MTFAALGLGVPICTVQFEDTQTQNVPGQVHVHGVLPLGVLMNYLNSGETVTLQPEVSPSERTKLEAPTCAEAPYFPRQAGPPWPSGAGKGTLVPWLVNSEQPADSVYGGTCRSPHAQGCTEGPRCRRGAVKAAAGSLQRGCRRTPAQPSSTAVLPHKHVWGAGTVTEPTVDSRGACSRPARPAHKFGWGEGQRTLTP